MFATGTVSSPFFLATAFDRSVSQWMPSCSISLFVALRRIFTCLCGTPSARTKYRLSLNPSFSAYGTSGTSAVVYCSFAIIST